MNKILRLFFLTFAVLSSSFLFSQSREYIRNAISKWGECRNVAITRYNGDLALYGNNGNARSGLPANLNRALDDLNSKREYIDDVQLTESGRYLVLYGNNGFIWNDIPYSLEQKIREFNSKGEVILTVSFNDNGDWIVITTDYYSSSDSRIQEWMRAGSESLGMIWTACVTDDAVVIVYENGYRFLGNVPQSLKNALNETKLDVYRLKIAGSSWFFADKNGNYRYSM